MEEYEKSIDVDLEDMEGTDPIRAKFIRNFIKAEI